MSVPAASLVWEASPAITVRGAWSRTIARQTFKELVAVFQQEFLGGPVFVGNPGLGMSSLKNYDLRLDYRPYEGGLMSLSWFRKEIEDPIEYLHPHKGCIVNQREIGSDSATFKDALKYILRQDPDVVTVP